MKINSVEYWNNRFFSDKGLTDWELCQGRRQSLDFMTAILKELPKAMIVDMKKSSILDYGCALGDGTNHLTTLNKKKIFGYDFSKNALAIARKSYSKINFIDKLEKYDYIICSHVLQCVNDCERFIADLTEITNKAIIILVPEGTLGTTVEHFNIFEPNSFKKDINGFYKRKPKLTNTRSWAYRQILLRYERI